MRGISTSVVVWGWTGIVALVIASSARAQCGDELWPEGGANSALFGSSVAADGDIVVVGRPGDDNVTTDAGAAEVFRWDGQVWLSQGVLRDDTPVPGEEFGKSVAVSHEVVVVGAPGDSSVFIFAWDGLVWSMIQEINQAADPHFGQSVDLDTDVLVIGGFTLAYAYRGYAGVWWGLEQMLLPGDSTGGFGSAVSVSGDVAIVGAPQDEDGGTQAGAAYTSSGTPLRVAGGTKRPSSWRPTLLRVTPSVSRLQ